MSDQEFTYVPGPKDISDEAEQIWLKNLEAFLDKLLANIVSNASKRKDYLTPEAMKIWKIAFTHETMSSEDNYEVLEFDGDTVLKLAFPTYMKQRLPGLKNSDYSELNRFYMSKINQGKMSHRMGLGEHVRSALINFNIEADLFESFFGALFAVSDLIVPGLGYVNSFNMVTYLMKSVKNIQLSEKEGHVKTKLNQMFEKFGSKEERKELTPSEEIIDVPEGKKSIISLTRRIIQLLKTYGVTVTNPVIGVGVGPVNKNASDKAYADALYNLSENYGVTPEWATDAKRYLDFSKEEYEPYAARVDAKLAARGLVDKRFFVSKKTQTHDTIVVSLHGVKPDGKEILLGSVIAKGVPPDQMGARFELIKNFAMSE